MLMYNSLDMVTVFIIVAVDVVNYNSKNKNAEKLNRNVLYLSRINNNLTPTDRPIDRAQQEETLPILY